MLESIRHKQNSFAKTTDLSKKKKNRSLADKKERCYRTSSNIKKGKTPQKSRYLTRAQSESK